MDTTTTTEAATERAHETIDRAHDTVERATASAHRVVDRASENARRWAASGQQLSTELGSYVSAHPVQTLAIAFATGFMLGRLLR